MNEEEQKKERVEEMKRCAIQWAKNRWPTGVTVEFIGDHTGAPFINIVDNSKRLSVDQAIEFQEYMVSTFPDLMRYE